MYLISNELAALEEISKMCGEVKSKEKEKTASTPLVTVSDLQRLSQFEIITIRLRMMPFKTKLVPNFKMNWGKNYGKAVFPTRERKPVELFEIREYVKAQKKEKMNEMLSGSDMSSIFGNNSLDSSPFGGMGGLPSFGINNGSDDSGFNVDDLVKRIDAKIAELEEEEKKEKENQTKVQQEEKEVSNNIYEDGTSDDAFFDDFFSDD